MPDTTYSVADLRTQLVANGYSPLPNVGKACYLPDWPKVEITAETIARWSRRHSRFQDTGLRVENGLAVIDLDINDEAGARAVAEAIEKAFPQLLQALVRYGKGYKEAWFCRTAEPFGRIHTFRFWAPGLNDPDQHEAHCVEIFGGGSPRQFGAFGAHTRDKAGDVVVAYEWADGSPLDVKLDDLPELTKADFLKISEIAARTLRSLNFEQVTRSTSGESEAVRVYDLTDEMVFECNDEVTRSLAELREIAGTEGLRCSASWLEPGRGHSLTRCLVGRSHSGQLTIWDSASGVTHMPADADPGEAVERQIDVDALAVRLKRLAEIESEKKARRRARLSGDDDYQQAAAKLTQTYAWCPTQQVGVVPLYATAATDGMTLAALRTTMLPWCGVELGPRGGERKINPADMWASSKERVTVEGLRLRPDRERPTYEEGGKTYVNFYAPQVHEEGGGTAAGGIALLEQLLPDAVERRWFTQWLAHKWLHPEVPGPAVIMVARSFGTGRSTLGELVKLLFGARYVSTIGFDHFAGRTYQSQYTAWQADALIVVVNESSTADNGSTFRTKHDTYERLKEIVDPRAQERTIVTHGKPAYKAWVFASYLIFTNNPDALPLPAEDRRFWVGSNGERQDREFWDGVNEWMREPANIAAFARWLEAVDLTGFSAYDEPPMTDGKRDMTELSRSDLDRAFDEAVEELPSALLTPEHMVAAIRASATNKGFDLPVDKLDVLVKKIAATKLHRVGVRHGENWFFKIGAKRMAIYARTKGEATRWTRSDREEVRREVLRNGNPADENAVQSALSKLKLAVDNGV